MARRVGRHERASGDSCNIVEACCREVTDIDDHSQSLHLGHGLHSEGSEARAGRGLACPVSQHRATVPGQRHAPHAQAPEGLQHAQAVCHRLGALDGQHQPDAARGERLLQILGGLDHHHLGGMGRGDVPGLLEQQQAPTQRALAHVLVFGEDGKKLNRHPAGPQPGKPEVAEGVAVSPLPLVQHGEQQVVVSVHHSHRAS